MIIWCIILGIRQSHATTLQVVQWLKFFFGGGGIFQGPRPPVWNPAQCSTIKGSIFTKLGHSVYYVYICTSIVVGLAQRPAGKLCRLISTYHHDVDQSWNESHSLSSMFSVITISKLDIYSIYQRRPLPIRRYRVVNTPSPWFQNLLSLSKLGEAASFFCPFIHAASTSSDEWIALKYSDTISVSWRVISRGWSYGWDNEPISFSFVKQHGLAVLKHSIQYEVLGVWIHIQRLE